MTDIYKNISKFIEGQFPAIYRDRGDELTTTDRAVIVDFVEAYFEYIESNTKENFLASREMFSYRDIDTTLEDFVEYFRKKYLNELPYVYSTDNRLVIKKIMDLYRTKGSEKALKLLIRLLFDEDIEVYYPSQDILRASTSTWVEPVYVEVTRNARNLSFLNTKITGADSGATAYVENLVTKRVAGKYIDVLYLNRKENGDFVSGEKISNDGIFFNAPTVVGSLSNIEVVRNNSNYGYSVGDILDVFSDDGELGKARVSSVSNIQENVTFELEESGFGYSLDTSEVLISDAVLFVNNANLEFNDFDIVEQSLAKIGLSDTSNVSLGDTVSAFNANSSISAEGFVVDKTSNTIVVEKTSGNFGNIYQIELVDTNEFSNDDIIEEESTVTLEITGLSGTFTPGETILQKDILNGAYQNIAYGTYVSGNTSTIQLSESWGTFIVDKEIEGRTSFETATIFSVEVTDPGATGTLISSNTTHIVIESDENFDAGNKIRGSATKIVNEISSSIFLGVDTANVAGTEYAIDSYENVSASGEVIAQNQNIVAISGNTSPFYNIDGANNLVTSPAGSFVIERIGNGSGAGFQIGSLNDNTLETIQYGTDLLNEKNIAGFDYLDIVIGTSENSGIGRIANTVNIVSGGSGYSNNSTITLSGGGFSNNEPIIPAILEPVTDGSGVIVSINVVDSGEGYYTTPSVSISDGAGADIALTIETGYGFPGLPYGDIDSVIEDTLQSTNTVIGEIASLRNVNPGSGYDTNVFTKIINRNISEFLKYDLTIEYTPIVGTFGVGEIIEISNNVVGVIQSTQLNSATVKRLSFVNEISVGDTISSQSSNVSATVTSVTDNVNQPQMGLNAAVSSEVTLQSGVIDTVEVVDSGFGYIDGNNVILRDGSGKSSSGVARVERTGRGSGFWKTTESQLNDKKIHDNDFYQEYSYQVIAGISLDKYEEVVKDILHVSGTKLFGKVAKNILVETDYTTYVNIEEGEWLLNSGEWDDTGTWLDNKIWTD